MFDLERIKERVKYVKRSEDGIYLLNKGRSRSGVPKQRTSHRYRATVEDEFDV
jgi:hypothetical protein